MIKIYILILSLPFFIGIIRFLIKPEIGFWNILNQLTLIDWGLCLIKKLICL